ncbi:Response regulator of zinc sigma-54-dependent two-component system [hydrothermal vent metagenome]|uniref:Response regulator of zinc sigma-54-dependent two-component system n=1 Tax=hydrothermal vent metagenome TaxID=652676 RepID=A0A3B0T465_9ZZZZ
MNKMHILLIEDTVPLAEVYMEYLQEEKVDVTHVTTGDGAYQFLSEHTPHIILLDMNLPDVDGMEILQYVSDQGIDSCVIVLTAYGSVSRVVEAMRLGAFEYLQKPFDQSRFILTVRNAMERMYLREMVDSYKNRLGRDEYHGMLGSSQVMQSVYEAIDNVAASSATVFLTGESGTGKELCAQAIHDQSKRKDGELVILNCGAIPKDLMESEIFGHAKGAFTGAISDREGAAQRADGGTLFLDEIGEMDINLQSKLLRLIQSGTFQRVGSAKTSKVDIRYICATNRDPLELMEKGLFREDLYYRLNVIPIKLPPLRERGRDKLDIALRFLRKFSREEDKKFRRYSPEVENVIMEHPWPGNVRQLQNFIRNIVVLNDGDMVEKKMLPGDFLNGLIRENNHITNDIITDHKQAVEDIRPLWQCEKEIIEAAIEICDGNISRAAGYLDVNPSTIYRKIKSWKELDPGDK